MINWKHIMDEQPKNEEIIIQIDPSYEGHYNIGMRKYISHIYFDDLLKFNIEHDCKMPDFWWISAKDFPFPKQKKMTEWKPIMEFAPPDEIVILSDNNRSFCAVVTSNNLRDWQKNKKTIVEVQGSIKITAIMKQFTCYKVL